jgi:peptidoglycan-associated lipoprotein
MSLKAIGLKAVVLAAVLLTAAACQTTKTGAGGPKPGSQEDLVANVGDRVFFDFDKYDLKADAQATLQRQAAWLKQYSANAVTIEGHCDERGTREYNLALGDRRANAVRDYLASQGIDGSRIKTISYGEERPECVESTEECWAKNRRGVTVVTAAGPAS